jgi:hypothetical protein
MVYVTHSDTRDWSGDQTTDEMKTAGMVRVTNR